MKKVLVLLAIVMISCSTPSEQSETSVDCKCGVVIDSQSFNVLGANYFSVIKVKNNCTGVVKQFQKDGVITIGTQLCNY